MLTHSDEKYRLKRLFLVLPAGRLLEWKKINVVTYSDRVSNSIYRLTKVAFFSFRVRHLFIYLTIIHRSGGE